MYSSIIQKIEHILQDHKGEDLLILPIDEVSSIACFMVICTATSKRHLHALHAHLKKALKPLDNLYSCDREESTWLIIDINDIIIHIMTKEARDYYRLESLWTDYTTELL